MMSIEIIEHLRIMDVSDIIYIPIIYIRIPGNVHIRYLVNWKNGKVMPLYFLHNIEPLIVL